MNRDFSLEYREYAENDTPDLWSRIEAGVDAYEAGLKEADNTLQQSEKSKVIDISSSPRYTDNTANSAITDKDDRRKTKGMAESRFAVFARRYGGMVAAVACGVAVLSAIGITKLASNGKYSSATAESAAPMADNAAAADAAAEMDEAPMAMGEAPAAMEEAEEADEEAVAQAAADDYDYAETAQEAAPAETYAAESYENYDEGAAGDIHTALSGASKKNSFRSESAKEAMDSLELKAADEEETADEVELTITARIASVSESSDKKDSDSNEYSCELIVTGTDDAGYKEGEKITATVDPAAVKEFKSLYDENTGADTEYTITLITKDAGKTFILKEIKP
ncbi:MAG: hypothetical protein IKP31_01765 [Lachnospiraceae bacterium]|nr:hypothetical protein [Lachnospiraceae bacterium]